MAKKSEAAIGAYMAIGAGVGSAIGVAVDSIPMGLSLGAAIGVLIGVMVANHNRNKQKPDWQSEDENNENA